MIYEKKIIKEFYIGAIIAITSLFFGIILIIPLFIGGTSNITVDTGDLLKKNTTNTEKDLYGWIFEVSGFSTIHHAKNFIISIYYATSIVYFLKFALQKFFHLPTGYQYNIIWIFYASGLQSTLAWAALWEIIEKFGVWLFQVTSWVWPAVPFFAFFSDFFGEGEAIYNTLLNDLPQAIIAVCGVLILMFFGIIKPPSYLMYKKKWYIILLRFLWSTIFGLLSAIITLKKDYGYTIMPWGWYSYFFFEIFSISILYLEDIHHITCRNGEKIIKLRELNKVFILTIIYIILQWFAAFHLLAPGFITSNIAYFFYILIIVIINKLIFVF